MTMPVKVANVVLWGSAIGAVSWDQDRDIAAFEYTPQFQQSGIELAPITMPLGPDIYSFPGLAKQSFYGLPGLLADALPDKFGNLLIDEWLIRSGRDRGSFTPVERLCYVGARGMGALEFEPAIRREADRSVPIDVAALVELAAEALAQKQQRDTRFTGEDHHDLEAMRDILRVGTSAGGARAKAVIAWNQATGEVRSGQVQAPPGFGYWLLKFDGVAGNRDKELDDSQGYGRIEYAYHLMALEAGVEMSPCRLFHEQGRSYFPQGSWTSQHQMSLNGKRDGFILADLRVAANRFRLFRGKRLDALLQHVDGAVGKWPEFADQAGVPAKRVEEISRNIRRLGQLRTS